MPNAVITSQVVLNLELDNNIFQIDGLSDMDHEMWRLIDDIRRRLEDTAIIVTRATYTRSDDNAIVWEPVEIEEDEEEDSDFLDA
jgi:hypothetical protein